MTCKLCQYISEIQISSIEDHLSLVYATLLKWTHNYFVIVTKMLSVRLKFCYFPIMMTHIWPLTVYYLCSENKDADQLRGDHEAYLRLCSRICKMQVSSRGLVIDKLIGDFYYTAEV